MYKDFCQKMTGGSNKTSVGKLSKVNQKKRVVGGERAGTRVKKQQLKSKGEAPCKPKTACMDANLKLR